MADQIGNGTVDGGMIGIQDACLYRARERTSMRSVKNPDVRMKTLQLHRKPLVAADFRLQSPVLRAVRTVAIRWGSATGGTPDSAVVGAIDGSLTYVR